MYHYQHQLGVILQKIELVWKMYEWMFIALVICVILQYVFYWQLDKGGISFSCCHWKLVGNIKVHEICETIGKSSAAIPLNSVFDQVNPCHCTTFQMARFTVSFVCTACKTALLVVYIIFLHCTYLGSLYTHFGSHLHAYNLICRKTLIQWK